MGPLNRFGNPERLTPAPTAPAITPRDLQIRLYQFADDSMMGRQVGRVGNQKGTDFIAAELKRLGLEPGGVNGTYFQNLPFHLRKFTEHSRITADGNPLAWNTDIVAVPGLRAPRMVVDAEVVFGGTQGDTAQQIPASAAAGKFVVLLPAPGGRGGQGQGFAVRQNFAPAPSRFADAAAVAIIDLDNLAPAQRIAINEPTVAQQIAPPRVAPAASGPVDSLAMLKRELAALQPQASFRLTRMGAAQLFKGQAVEALAPGTRGAVVNAALDFVELPTEFGRNVIGIIPGSDPKLRQQYVAIGAHNDHVGFTTPIDKDSLKAFNEARNRLLLANNMKPLGPEQVTRIRVNMDSIRKMHPTPRLDSINNGADDDGSGSMGVLEIAEAIMAMPVKPKRSLLFVWHTGEEAGLLGAAHFTRNPTVPIDSIVAQLNIDMIGRGRAEDLPGGSDDYVAVIGSLFDSKDLGETVAKVNTKQAKPLALDYKFDEPSDWSGYNNIYGRSDHFRYAQQGIPIAFFFTGLHGDYHQRTDEPEWIDYPHYARIANYIRDITVEVANGPRPRLNGSKPAKPKVIVP
ncbi:M28 family metallopeptidase [Gemmatimonas phototrophica]|uniref:M28 family metallopeptidase n=1 Tax=Gemmatimonas phototrophica TaxID=1379270 RepID=UPI0006A70B2A|nr:M28 family peptidase [Gemmatimonas phototrophica]